MVEGEHLARASEARRNFVGDEQDVVLVAERAQLRQIFGGIYPHAGAALKQRLDYHCAAFGGALLEKPLRKGEALDGAATALFAAWAAVAVRRLNALHVHEHRLVYLRVEVEAADRERAYRLAVVAVREADEFRLLGMSRLVLVLERHLERAFDGGGAVVGEVEFRQGGGRAAP